MYRPAASLQHLKHIFGEGDENKAWDDITYLLAEISGKYFTFMNSEWWGSLAGISINFPFGPENVGENQKTLIVELSRIPEKN